MFSFLSDIGDAFGHADEELHSSGWHDGPFGKTCYVQSGNGCWELFCLEHGMQPDGQLPPFHATDCIDDALITSPKTSSEIQPVPRSVMADLRAMVVDDVRTGTRRQPFHKEAGIESAENSFARGCYAMRPKFVDPAPSADNCARLQPGQVPSGRAARGSRGGDACKGGSVSGLGCPLLERLLFDCIAHPTCINPCRLFTLINCILVEGKLRLM